MIVNNTYQTLSDKATFKAKYQTRLQNKKLQENQKQILMKQAWYIYQYGNYRSWQKIFNELVIAHCESLVVTNLQISLPFYDNMTQLILNNCKLQSIQALIYIKAPYLASIQLENNDLMSIKPLNRMRFQKLWSLNFQNNYINSVDLARISLFKDFKHFKLWFQYDWKLLQTMSVMVKMQQKQIVQSTRIVFRDFQSINNNNYQGIKCINQVKTINVLRQKFNQHKIKPYF